MVGLGAIISQSHSNIGIIEKLLEAYARWLLKKLK